MPNYKKEIREKIGNTIEYVSMVDAFLQDILSTKYIEPKESKRCWSSGSYLSILRQVNSYYPSFFDVDGGCYVISILDHFTIIDPGYRTLKLLRENKMDSRNIRNIIITHNHPDHNGGLPELLNLLFSQTGNVDIKYKLYLNPGTKKEYSHYIKDKNLEIIEIKSKKKYILEEFTNESIVFKGIPVFHTGIGRKQKSIGLQFTYKNDDHKLDFGIMGDTDGNEKYMKYYKKKFHDLDFLIIHIGSLKFKSLTTKKQKHLYPDGVLRLVSNLRKIKYYILQEFGMELLPPNELSKVLFRVLNPNGFFLPYIILRILHERESEINGIFKNEFLARLLSDYFSKESKNILQKWIAFSQILALDFQDSLITLYDFWEEDEEDFKKKREMKNLFIELWEHYKNFYYWKISELDFEYIDRALNSILTTFKNPAIQQTYEKNIEKLLPLCNIIAFKDIEKIFGYSPFKFYDQNEFFFRILTLEYYSSGNSPDQPYKYFKWIGLLIFLKILMESKIPLKFSGKNTNPITEFTPIYEDFLDNNQINSKIIVGKYGSHISFKIFWETNYFCKLHKHYTQSHLNVSDLFREKRCCPICEQEEFQWEFYQDIEPDFEEQEYYRSDKFLDSEKKEQAKLMKVILTQLEKDEKYLETDIEESQAINIGKRIRNRLRFIRVYIFSEEEKSSIYENALKFLNIISISDYKELFKSSGFKTYIKRIFLILPPKFKMDFRNYIKELDKPMNQEFISIIEGIDIPIERILSTKLKKYKKTSSKKSTL